ncbi:unnamed protein product [Rotaria sp. Silwood2]|nr:unnamed protein product [Rotaria sp. Silwood2]CAF2915154.1 unnamed protein product [Rotaria sp. Silwood2]CAF4076886.1 unnamed protein product [Rotaria sp. Silwood2]CAF4298339.1 unnamed protein product [Rotaria sp. Silwood2]
MWQIDYNQLRIGIKIGMGQFGEVKRGLWKRKGVVQPSDVAIKNLKLRDEESNAFAQEIRAMKILRHRFLVSLYEITLDPMPNQKLLITEFMNNGDLKKWLEEQPIMPSNDVLINYALPMCLGMAHLERRNYVHRDLACRNVLLRDQYEKISDFGMADIVEEDPYAQQKARGKLEFRWTAPKIFTAMNYTSKADVWSFGICLIEMWNKGGQPYSTMKNSKEIIEKVRQGHVHEKPTKCPQEYYTKIITPHLKKDRDERLSFQALISILKALRSNRDDMTSGIKQVEKFHKLKTYCDSENINKITVTNTVTHQAQTSSPYYIDAVANNVEQNNISLLSAMQKQIKTILNHKHNLCNDSAKASYNEYESIDSSSE